jgi:hypothetical protein
VIIKVAAKWRYFMGPGIVNTCREKRKIDLLHCLTDGTSNAGDYGDSRSGANHALV